MLHLYISDYVLMTDFVQYHEVNAKLKEIIHIQRVLINCLIEEVEDSDGRCCCCSVPNDDGFPNLETVESALEDGDDGDINSGVAIPSTAASVATTTSINVGTSSTTVPAIATMTTPALPVAFSPTSVSTAIVAGTTTQLAAGGAVAASSTHGTTNLAPQNVQPNQGRRLHREDAFICSFGQLRSAKSWSDLYAA